MNVNILLFDGFETLDAFGPVEILGKIDNYKLNYIPLNGAGIVSAQGASINTDKFESAPKEGILVIPLLPP